MKTAILLLGYKKLETFSKVVESLSKQTKQYDLFVKFDNCGDESYTNKLIEKVKEYFPNANISVRSKRYCLDLQVVCSLNEMFLGGYDRVFYTEDDVVYTPNALETLENLMDWTDKNLEGIGIVQSWNYNNLEEPYLTEYKKEHHLDRLWYNCTYEPNEIGYTCQNFWGALISKKTWELCQKFVLFHYATIVQRHGIDFLKILSEIAELSYSKSSPDFKYRIISRFNVENWEALLDLAMQKNNLFKICLTNPRSKTIGAEGETSTDSMFYRCGLDKIKLCDSKEIPTEFILNKESEKKFLNV